MTENSSSTSYATATHFVTRYDVRTIGQLVNDDGTAADATAVLSNTVVVACLKDASGMIEAACLRGKRYQPTDLVAMTGVNANLLQRLVCALAMWMLMDRRSLRTLGEPTPMPDWITGHLNALADGTEIFGFTQVQDAGLMETVTRQDTDAQNPNRITERARRFFGDRGEQVI